MPASSMENGGGAHLVLNIVVGAQMAAGEQAKVLIAKKMLKTKRQLNRLEADQRAKSAQKFSTARECVKMLGEHIAISVKTTIFKWIPHIDVAPLYERLIPAAKFIDRTVGVTKAVVSIDRKLHLAPKLERAATKTKEKIHGLFGNGKIGGVVSRACKLDNRYFSGTIQGVATHGYGMVSKRISDLWSDYKVKLALPVTA